MARLNRTESKVLSLYIGGSNREMIGTTMGLKAGTVAHTFSDIRGKLEIPRDTDIGQFFLARIPREVLRQYI